MQNEYKSVKSVTLVSKIVDAQGQVLDRLTSSLPIKPFGQIEIEQEALVRNPALWSPETPVLYEVQTEVMENGKIVDTYETTFGIRTVEMRTDGFYLNGKLYPIKGTVNHQDFAGVGVALPDKINEYKIKLLKEMGSNGYRSGHHPPTPRSA